MTLRIERISELSQMSESLEAAWAALPMPTPMQSPKWLRAWWEAFGDPNADQLCILFVLDDDQLVGVAPWYLSRQRTGGQVLRFLGDGLVCSDHSEILTRYGYWPGVITCLAEWLGTAEGATWHSIHFESVDDSSTSIRELIRHLADGGCEVHIRNTTGCWGVEMPDTWAQYLASLSKNHRKRCRRWQRVYFDSGRAKVVRRTADDVNEAWTKLAELNQLRRARLGDRSAFTDDRFLQFHLSVLPDMMANQKVEIRELVLDGELVASEYVFVHDDAVFCYQSGMKTSKLPDGYGNLSILAMVRDAIEKKCRRLDFLRGDEPYKRHWGAERADCVDYHVGSKSFAGAVQVKYFRAVDWVRTMRTSLIEASV